MAYSLIQSNIAQIALGETAPLAFLTNVQSGTLLIVDIVLQSGGLDMAQVQCTDTRSNSWTKRTYTQAGITVVRFEAVSNGAGACTVTTTWTGEGAQNGYMVVGEHGGISAFDKLCQKVEGTGVTATAGSSGTLAAANAVAIATVRWAAVGGNDGLITAGAGYTLPATAGNIVGKLTVASDDVIAIEYQVVAATTALAPSFTNAFTEDWGAWGGVYTLAGVTAAVTGTVISAAPVAADIVAGGKTILLTVSGDTFVASGGTFDAIRQDIINGLDSGGAESHAWDAEVKAKIAVTDVVRTSATVVTITLDAEAAYAITAPETVTATVPASALVLAGAVVATPTFAITPHGVPTLSAISPNLGPAGGGTVVTLTGTNFVSGATVTIGGTSCTSVVIASPTSITAVTGAHAAGALDVVVTTDSGTATLAGGFYQGIVLFGSVGSPVDGAAAAQAGPNATVTPPVGMQLGDVVEVDVQYRGSVTLTVGTTGGQTWTSLTANTATTNVTARKFYCVFNGTWAADPVFTNTAGTNALTAVMRVWRGVDNTTPIDVALTNGTNVAAATQTITGITTLTDGACVVASWFTADDNTWAAPTGGFSTAGSAQYRNTTGTDQSAAGAYLVVASHGASGNVSRDEGGAAGTNDATATMIFALKAATNPSGIPAGSNRTYLARTTGQLDFDSPQKVLVGSPRPGIVPRTYPATTILSHYTAPEEWETFPLARIMKPQAGGSAPAATPAPTPRTFVAFTAPEQEFDYANAVTVSGPSPGILPVSPVPRSFVSSVPPEPAFPQPVRALIGSPRAGVVPAAAPTRTFVAHPRELETLQGTGAPIINRAKPATVFGLPRTTRRSSTAIESAMAEFAEFLRYFGLRMTGPTGGAPPAPHVPTGASKIRRRRAGGAL